MDIIEKIRSVCTTNSDKLAFIDERYGLTYKDFDRDTTKLASAFVERLKVLKGQRILLMLPNSIDYVVCLFAAMKVGITVVPANPTLKVFEIEHILKDSGATILITTPEILEQIFKLEELGNLTNIVLSESVSIGLKNIQVHTLDELKQFGRSDFKMVQTKPTDIEAIFYTSGTTGKPKGSMLSNQMVIIHGDSTIQALNMTPEDRHICVLPMAHLFSQDLAIIPALFTGGTVYIVRQFEAEKVLSLLAENKITVMAGVNTMYARMLEVPNAKEYNLSSLRCVIAGAAALSAEVARKFKEIFNIDILPGYGSTETSVVTLTPPGGPIKIGSIGKRIPGIRVSIQDDNGTPLLLGEAGELMVGEECVMRGYVNLPEATKEIFKGGWLSTGDIVTMDEDGYIYIVGRKKEMINTSGYSVFPKEVEDIMSNLKKIKEVAVVGLPDEVRGEIVAAFIVPAEESLTEEEVLSFCKENLAVYKIPRKVQFLQNLPKTSTGKIEKGALRERYAKTQS
ncbi:MAG: AMP-binding protein [Thermodesulfobacteriota bacterium]